MPEEGSGRHSGPRLQLEIISPLSSLGTGLSPPTNLYTKPEIFAYTHLVCKFSFTIFKQYFFTFIQYSAKPDIQPDIDLDIRPDIKSITDRAGYPVLLYSKHLQNKLEVNLVDYIMCLFTADGYRQ